MDVLSNLMGVMVKPSGFWPNIINAFESGVGSYLLAVVLITLILRVILIPFDFVNKRLTKKQSEQQEKLKPELEKLQKKYGNDRNLLNQKTNELYKKSGVSMGGSCLFMLIFMALNLTIFFTLFGSLNGIADYKINEQYSQIKDSYTNVLYLSDEYYKEYGNLDVLQNNENLNVELVKEEDKTWIKLKDEETVIFSTLYKNDFSYYTNTGTKLSAGDITEKVVSYDTEKTYTQVKVKEIVEEKEVEKTYYILTENIIAGENSYTITVDVDLYNFNPSNQGIIDLINKYIVKNEDDTGYIGDTVISGEQTFNSCISALATKESIQTYDQTQKDYSFLWISNIWVADSPFKNSIFTFDEFKNEIGAVNVEEKEDAVYSVVMTPIREQKGRANGYFLLAIISIGVAFLGAWLNKKYTTVPMSPDGQKSKAGIISLLLLPLIMGIFAILYNSLFAIYMIVSQAISLAFTPLTNLINKKWEKHDKKKEESKQATVDYRRK